MRARLVSGTFALLTIAFHACGSDDGKKSAPHLGDAGAAGAEDASGGAGGSPPAVAGSAGESGFPGAGATSQGGSGAGGEPAIGGAGGEPGIGDAGGVPAIGGAGGAGGATNGTFNVIYATFNGMLVRIDPETAELVEIDVTRNATQPATTYPDVVMTWDHQQDVARLLVNPFTAPQLGVLDLCNATVTLGPALTVGSVPLTNAEAMSQHPNGTFYVGSGVTQYYSPTLGTLDVGTGAVTNIGNFDTTQDDADHYEFVDDELHVLDVGTAVYGWYRLSLATGAASVVAEPAGTTSTAPLRVAYDATRQQAFGWTLNGRQLVSFHLADASFTAIGQTHAAGTYANAPVRGFMSAPPADCP